MYGNDRPGAADLYAAARTAKENGFSRDGSLFTPGRDIWTLLHAQELRRRFVEHPDTTKRSFEEKLKKQLAGASDSVIQLAAELLFVYFWIISPRAMSGTAKKARLAEVLSWAEHPAELPAEMSMALERGLIAPGIAYMANKNGPFEYLVELLVKWKGLTGAERAESLVDPWKFKTMAESVPVRFGGPMRLALLHFVFPETFEAIISSGDRKKITDRFREMVAEPSEDLDRLFLQIRAKLAPEYGEFLNFYEPELKSQWDSAGWPEFFAWALKFETLSDERAYKLKIADKMAAARAAVVARQDSWLSKLKNAFGGDNNLVSTFSFLPFLGQCEASPSQALDELSKMWSATDPVAELGWADTDLIPAKVRNAGRTSICASLLMGIDPVRYPPYQHSAIKTAAALVGYPDVAAGKSGPVERYPKALAFFDEVLKRAPINGLALADRLDAQGAVWCVAGRTPPRDWSPDDRQALLDYRAKAGVADDDLAGEEDGERPTPPAARDALNVLADDLLVPAEFIEEVRDLLEAKRQVIFYGPPGTGKTYLARRLAQFFAGSKDRVQLVQFHPSYTYEDFVEGFRPTEAGAFKLVDGPLKTVAGEVRSDGDRRVLVIDEINRANVTKVLGELYFLLEYRNEEASLQYSRQPFTLPEDLWIIGTMNTADRSIALLDGALRRRFYFVPLFPDHEPVRGLLRRWLARHKPDLNWIADVVDLANAELQDRDAAIGPSYFMVGNLNEAWARRIWERSVIPYLEERFVGDSDRLKGFDLNGLRARALAQKAE